MRVSFNRFAEQELVAAARHLEIERHLGVAFLDEYEAWERQVLAFPDSCREIAPTIRCGYLPRFKYHVTYQFRGDVIRILYLRHARRGPLDKWTRR